MNGGFVVEVRRPDGATIIRRRLNRTQVVAGIVAAVLLVSVVALAYARLTYALGRAWDQVVRLGAERAVQQSRLDALERQAQSLQHLNLESQRSIERIERKLGDRRARLPAQQAAIGPAAHRAPADPDAMLGLRLRLLAAATVRTHVQADRLAGLAARVLNLRRLAAITRTRMLAEIPSLNPVNGPVNAAFGWRTDPWPEFHKGLDLAADYGTVVRAAADGTVAAAGWDGGFGIKIDIDHQNGYHTWYCHLSHVDVRPGERVLRGEAIAAVGTTGESTGPHLHYQVMHDGVAIDPMPYLNGVPTAVLATLPADPRVQ
jgi:murein DD-endopeptidase MepM/ murein hydrolase activator NlpD